MTRTPTACVIDWLLETLAESEEDLKSTHNGTRSLLKPLL